MQDAARNLYRKNVMLLPLRAKEYNKKDGGVDVCTAIKELIEEGTKERMRRGRQNELKDGKQMEKILLF